MIGNNELHLNQATLIQAMQEWLDKRLLGYAPKVTAVKSESKGYSVETFIVSTTDREPQADMAIS